jgi:exopolysaccharide production protein ExoY
MGRDDAIKETTMSRSLALQTASGPRSRALQLDQGGSATVEFEVAPTQGEFEGTAPFGFPATQADGGASVYLQAPHGISTRDVTKPPTAVGGLSKRTLDILIASSAIAAILPLMVVVWLIIRCSSGAPAIFVQQRVGLGGRLFPCFKFRTMCLNSRAVLEHYLATQSEAALEWQVTQKLKDDPRVTRVGRILRKTSLDELPQLLNVLCGHMSCVGPRPVLAEELPRYGSCASSYLQTRPGLTGMWQVSGRSKLSYDDRVTLDTQYVKQWSMLLDIKILLKTITVLAKFDGAV